ncbi:ABC transporter permease subunit [Leptolyngbyaceae cyanobacterium CCMR0082]|uniref:ABC transporter permease subunit n=2 Tax=Adonisia turfae TaxID=2950184 RepID=A0A6M0SE55_9CYAN|nr:ABC transporter permease subunit [Adonisia turfae]MDV3352792.1 ABC transporter permease subunit [Leptothoe sp. LEGE 181152]NEZ56293.1 ABC transporter permease subunit [Adonisia turfae CCMR0081]NEZ65942.1 ABC transporter permease subunit [Adonisia turfae CCMR0082]
MTSRSNSPISGIQSLFRDERFWKIAFQALIVLFVVNLLWHFSATLNDNMLGRGIQFGFGFLKNSAGFGIGESLLDYKAQDTYTKVIQVGIINSLRVMIVGVILATTVGITAGVASFSDNWLLYKISRAYVGLVRNVPLLLQLFFWYLAVFFSFPAPRSPFIFPNANASWLVLSKKGIYLPGPSFTPATWTSLILLAVSLLLIGVLMRSIGVIRAGRYQGGIGPLLNYGFSILLIPILVLAEFFLLFNWNAGKGVYFKGALPALFSSSQGLWVIVLLVMIVPLVLLNRWRTQLIVEQGQSGKPQLIAIAGLLLLGVLIILFALGWEAPVAGVRDDGTFSGGVTGGLRLSLEYSAIVTGLTFYTGAFIAEIVRAGIQSVSQGQWEAARSLGLSSGLAMRMVVFPQALRVIIPPLNSEFANLAKNSSLALAIGYPDLYSVANTTFNQTGRPVEVFLLMMATYLIINLLISVNMNQLNSAVQFKER